MKWILSALAAALLFTTFWLWQVDGDIALLANKRLKYAINRAAHDASLQVNKTELNNKGKIIFDTFTAETVFKKTLADNLALTEGLIPNPNTLFSQQISITYMDFIDDTDGVTFPYLYENMPYGIRKIIYGPAVIFAVETPKPRPFNISDDYFITKWAVFEYPG